MQAAAIEQGYRNPIMPAFHAAWTGGAAADTLDALATHRWSFALAIVAPLPYSVAVRLVRDAHPGSDAA